MISAVLLTAASLAVVSCKPVAGTAAATTGTTATTASPTSQILSGVLGYLAQSSQISTAEQATAYVPTWNKVQTAITSAQNLGVTIPQTVKSEYNSTLTGMQSNNYFGSSELQAVMTLAQLLK